MSISAHWSTSGAFFDIAAEAWKAVNPGIEFKGFLMGGMSASQAVEAFLEKMKAYKPDETYLFVAPDSQIAMEKLIVGMQQVGSRVIVRMSPDSLAVLFGTQEIRKVTSIFLISRVPDEKATLAFRVRHVCFLPLIYNCNRMRAANAFCTSHLALPTWQMLF